MALQVENIRITYVPRTHYRFLRIITLIYIRSISGHFAYAISFFYYILYEVGIITITVMTPI